MNYLAQTNVYAPQKTPQQQGVFNTAVAKAQASADPRFNMKAMDRNGVSRSAGTLATGGIQAADSLASGIAAAYGQRDADAVTDANNELQYQTNQENFGQGAYGVAMQNDYANALAALQRTQNTLQYQGNALGGLLGSVGNAVSSNTNYATPQGNTNPGGSMGSVGNVGNLGTFGNYNGTYRF